MKTAVITASKFQFEKWVANHPDYPKPIWIADMADVKEFDEYLYVVKTTGYDRILNYRIITGRCIDKVVLRIAVIGTTKRTLRRGQVLIPNVHEANKYYYSKIIHQPSAKEMSNYDNVFEAVQARLVTRPDKKAQAGIY